MKMKNLKLIIILFSLIFTNLCYSQSGWFWQNPLSSNATFYKVQFINNNTGYICGNDINVMGFCLKTTDDGNTWHLTDYDFGDIYQSLSFINENTGCILGKWNHTFRKTTNGGMTWTSYGVIYYIGHDYYDINFVDENTGYVMGDVNNYNLIRTTNGGSIWTTLNTGTFNVIWKTQYLGNNTIFAVGELGEFLKSYDMGNTWNEQQISPYYFFRSLYFANINSGYICGNGRIYKTTNNGNNWTEQNIPRHPRSFSDLEFIDLNKGYAVGDSSCVIKTSNGGVNWNVMHFGNNDIYNDISLQSYDSGFIVGFNGTLLKMTDQGNSYESVRYTVRNNLKSLCTVDSTFAFVVGDSGSMMKYSNNKWYTVNSGFTNNFFSIYFINNQTGIAVGSEELIIRTTNTGNSWEVVHSNGNKKLNSVHLLNELGYAVGEAGLILKSTNAGISWFSVNSGVNTNLNKLTIIDSNNIIIVGNSGLLLKSTNAGLNWLGNILIPNKDLNSIYSEAPSNLFIAGDSATFLKSTNGGDNWQTIILPTITYDIHDVMFKDNIGYLAGDNGKILKSTNFGINWGFQFSGVTNNLNALSFFNVNTGYTVGDNGVIRKTTNGGGTILTGIPKIAEIPNIFSLSQNYPNPFNPQTKIKFSIPLSRGVTADGGRGVFVSLIIYDLLGCEVATLVNEELKPGTYEAYWDASGYSSGVYFYKLVVDDPSTGSGRGFVETKKMVLMK